MNHSHTFVNANKTFLEINSELCSLLLPGVKVLKKKKNQKFQSVNKNIHEDK